MVLDTAVTLAVSFTVIALGFCLTLHVAARYVLGDVRVRRALAGAIPAAVVFVLTVIGQPLTAAVLAIIVDVIAIQTVYRVSYSIAGLVTLVHFTVSIIVAFTLRNLLALLGTAPV